jgi:tetratricopeptide (TPR) repeat protein
VDFCANWFAVAGSAFLSIGDAGRAYRWIGAGLEVAPRSSVLATLAGARQEIEVTAAYRTDLHGLNAPQVRRLLLGIIDVYRKAIAYDAAYAGAHLRLGRLQMLLGDLVAARTSIEQAQSLSQQPEYQYLSALTLGAIVQRQGDLLSARASYERALKIVPNAQTATVAIGYLDVLSGRPDRARARAQAFIADPADDIYWWEFKNGGLYREGLAWLRERIRR